MLDPKGAMANFMQNTSGIFRKFTLALLPRRYKGCAQSNYSFCGNVKAIDDLDVFP